MSHSKVIVIGIQTPSSPLVSEWRLRVFKEEFDFSFVPKINRCQFPANN